MSWRVFGGEEQHGELRLGDIAYGEPELVRALRVVNDGANELNLRLRPDDELRAIASRVAFQCENANLSADTQNDPVLFADIDGQEEEQDEGDAEHYVQREDDNLLFNECELMDTVKVAPHSNKRVLLLFRSHEANMAVSEQLELAPFSGSVVVENIEPPLVSTAAVQGSRSLVVSGRICTSLIRSEVNELSFNPCVPNKRYVKDFTIRNLSEVSTIFRVRSTSESATSSARLRPLIEFADYETGATLSLTSGRVAVAGFSHRRIRVIFKPEVVGEYEYAVDIDNFRNEGNTCSVRVFTAVTRDHPVDDVELSCGEKLDFGDCYAFNAVSRRVSVRNSSSESVDLKLSSDRPQQIAFELTMKEGSEPVQVAEPLLEASSTSTSSTAQSSPRDMPTPGKSAELKAASGTGAHSLGKAMDVLGSSDRDDGMDSVSVHRDDKWPFDKRNKVEELVVSAGKVRWIKVWYWPTAEVDNSASSQRDAKSFLDPRKSGSLIDNRFRLHLRSSTSSSSTVYCRARVCESVVKIYPKETDLGDCDVQTQRSTIVNVINCSDLPAFVAIKYVSKCVTTSANEIVIAPRQIYDLLLNYVPRKVNPEYSKQITFVNQKNVKNDSVFRLRANVIDRNRVAAHAFFYKLLSSAPNEIDFGSTVEGYPAIQVVEVQNVTTKRLSLRLEYSTQVSVFQPNKSFEAELLTPHAQAAGKPPRTGRKDRSQRDELLLQIDERSKDAAHVRTRSVSTLSINRARVGNSNVELNPLVDRAGSTAAMSRDTATKGRLQNLAQSLKRNAVIPTFFTDFESERNYVEAQLRPMKMLSQAVNEQLLIKSNELELEGGETVMLFVCYAPREPRKHKQIGYKVRPVEERMLIHLVQYDESRLAAQREVLRRCNQTDEMLALRPREVTLSVLACKSEMEMAQKQLNFGDLFLGEQRAKSLVFRNRAEAPLLYRIRKSGSVASGDIRFDSARYGVLRPYSSKEVPFLFAPSLAGAYEEKITVENLLDKRDVQQFIVKANLYKKRTFQVQTHSSSDFGECIAEKLSQHVVRFTVTNYSEKSRRYTVEAVPRDAMTHDDDGQARDEFVTCVFHREQQKKTVVVEEGDIDSLEQKLKIYERKGKSDKAKKTLETLTQLRENQDKANSQAEEQMALAMSNANAKATEVFTTFTVRGGDRQTLAVQIVPDKTTAGRLLNFSLAVYETKNKDEQSRIDCSAQVISKTNEEEADLRFMDGESSDQPYQSPKMGLDVFKVEPQLLEIKELPVCAAAVALSFRLLNVSADACEFTIAVPATTTGAGSSGSSTPPSSEHDPVGTAAFSSVITPSSAKLVVSAVPARGVLQSEQEVEINVSVEALTEGRHEQNIFIECFRSEEVKTASALIIANAVIRPLITLPEATEDGTLDLGPHAIDPTRMYTIDKAIAVSSLADRKLLLQARSNLSSQVFVLDCVGGLVDSLELEPRESVTVRICVAPKVFKDERLDGSCRSLVGGLQFLLRIPGSERVLLEQTFKISALVGESLLRIEERELLVAVASSVKAIIRDHFSVTNRSQGLDATIEILPKSSRLRVSKPRCTLAPKSTTVLHTALACDRPGLFTETINVHNMDSPSRSVEVSMAAFVDPHMLTVGLPQDELGTPSLRGSLAYLSPPTTNHKGWRVIRAQPQKLTISRRAGHFEEEETLFTLSLSNHLIAAPEPVLGSEEDEEAIASLGRYLPFPARRRAFRFGGSGTQVTLEITRTQVFEAKESEEKALRLGKTVESRSLVLFTTLQRQQKLAEAGQSAELGIVKAIHVYEKLCVSMIRIADEQPLSFGLVGHCNGWRPVTCTFELENMSDVPTSYSIGPLPAPLAVIRSEEKGDIAARGSTTVTLRLRPEELRDTEQVGDLRFDVPIRNLYNDNNVLMLQVHTTITAPRLVFERLEQEPEWQMTLPTQVLPDGPRVDGWFRMTNSGDAPLTVEIDVEPVSEAFMDLFTVSVVDLSSDAPLRSVKLSSKEFLAVTSFQKQTPPTLPGILSNEVGINPALEVRLRKQIRVLLTPNLETGKRSGIESALKAFGSNLGKSLGPRTAPNSGRTSSASSRSGSVPPRADDFDSPCSDTDVGERLATMQMCSIIIRSYLDDVEEPIEVVHVYGSVRWGSWISVSSLSLSLSVKAVQESDVQHTQDEEDGAFELYNLWRDVPLNYLLKVVGLPSELSLTIDPTSGSLPVGESQVVKVRPLLRDDAEVRKTKQYAPFRAAILVYNVDNANGAPDASISVSVQARNWRLDADASSESGAAHRHHSEENLRKPKCLRGSNPILEALHTLSPLRAQGQLDDNGVAFDGQSVSSDIPSPPNELNDPPAHFISLPMSASRHSRGTRIDAPVSTTPKGVPPGSVAADVITMKGCSVLPGSGLRYETNIGQVTAGSLLPPWKITFEVSCDTAIEMKVHRFGYDNYQGWLTLSRNGGIIERGRPQVLELNFNADRVGVYSTYLLVENRANPTDMKTLKVCMEVVADGSITGVAEKFFSVLCDRNRRTLEYSIVLLDHVYRHRSFFIMNHSDIELEFLLSHDLPPQMRTEVSFSSTNVTFRKVSSLVVSPRQKRRMFLYFKPRLEEEERLNMESDVDLIDAVLMRNFNVYISCRLVKDYQEIIEVSAPCKPSQLHCSKLDFLFDLDVSSMRRSTESRLGAPLLSTSRPSKLEEEVVSVLSHSGHLLETLEIRNLFPSELEYEIRNDSLFFTVDADRRGVLRDHGSSAKVTIRLDSGRLRERLSFLVKERYVEEHISVYNRRRAEEYFWVHLRLSLGGSSEFSAVMHTRAHAFSVLEELVATFLHHFSGVWARYRRPRVVGAGADSLEIAMASVGDDRDSVHKMLAKINEKRRSASVAAGSQPLDEWVENLNHVLETDEYNDLIFFMHYVTDELVYYALRHDTNAALRLATTVYTCIFKHSVFLTIMEADSTSVKMPPILTPWAGQLRHFLSYFPDKADHFETLLSLDARLSVFVTDEELFASVLATRRIGGNVAPSPSPASSPTASKLG